MNPEKLPQNQDNDRYNFDDLLPAEQEIHEANFDQLDAKVTAAENHHKNEVERQERYAKLESVRQQLNEFSADGASPSEVLSTAKSLVVPVPTRNKHGIVAMADAAKTPAKTGESESTTTAQEGEASGETESTTPPPAKRTSAWRHPIKAWREKADQLMDARDEREAAAAKAAQEAAERNKDLIEADENPTRFTTAAKPSRAELKAMRANTKAAQKEQQQREAAARQSGMSATDAIRELPEEKKPVAVKVEQPDETEKAEEVTATEPEAEPATKKQAAKVVKVTVHPEPAAIPAVVRTGTGPQTPAERSAEIARYRQQAREAALASTATDEETTTGDGGSAESTAVLSSTVPAPRAAVPEAAPVVGSGENGQVTLDDLDNLDALLGEVPPVTLTVEEGEEGDVEKTQPLATVEDNDDGSSIDVLENALNRGEANEEGESPRSRGRVRRALGAAATSFMDSRLMTGRWRDASAEAREERQAQEDEERTARRRRQLARDARRADANGTAPSAWLGTVEAAPDDPDNPDNDSEEPSGTGTGENTSEPDNGDGGNPDDPNRGTDENNPERGPGFMKRNKRRLGLAAAGLMLTGLAGASAEFAPDSHAPRTSVSAEGHSHDNKADAVEKHETTDKKSSDANASETGDNSADKKDSGSEAELPPKGGNTAVTPGITQNETDTVEQTSDGDVIVTLKQGGTIYQSGIDAGLNATDVMNAVDNAHITDAMARGMQVGQQIDFHKSDNGEWTVKLR